ncbi:hypothetical protein [Anaeromyxobacter terrae]|uniref:hypothetical protein n=1 Tax=Anaeromyxobacter terrae TaxID=2925406 RepID=UPI001F575776|nr:hypothetical protein [Anaeromyxobacter sp. SG22]
MTSSLPAAACAIVLSFAFACNGGSPTPVPEPTPEPTPTPTPEPTPATVTFEQLDSSDECAGLVPSTAPSPVTVTLDPAAGSVCDRGISDGTGHVAVAARDAAGRVTWHTFAADGSVRGSFSAWPLEPEPSGWHALDVSSERPYEVDHLSVSPDASSVSRTWLTTDPGTSYFRAALCEDPLGGSVSDVAGVDQFHNHFHAVPVTRFDAAGEVRCRTHVGVGSMGSEPLAMACGVSNRGEALHVSSQGTGSFEVAWTDIACRLVATGWVEYGDFGPVERVAPLLDGNWALEPLLDGDIAVRIGTTWTSRIAHLGTTLQPAPSWLVEREGFTYRFTRGNRGYALFPPPGLGAPSCTQEIELLSPSGRRCGRVVLHEDASGCTTRVADQGWDGTVVQQSGREACTYRWWPGLLAGD